MPSLSSLVEAAVERAVAARALVPFETVSSLMVDEESGMQFVIARSLLPPKKPTEKDVQQAQQSKEWRNPFLPHEEDLYVGELTDEYKLLLNKFNVVRHHLILATKVFQQQIEPLKEIDFVAAEKLLQSMEGVVFFNYGKHSGMSQPHRHLQFIPRLSDDERFPRFPLEEAKKQGRHVPFLHAFDWREGPNQDRSPKLIFDQFQDQLSTLGRPESFNLLLSRRWICTIPRTRSEVDGIGLNAVGFLGGVLIKSDEQALLLKKRSLGDLLRMMTT
mmetsp:Transcript_40801/g.105853  ORF Transcript_40801/g.105853 Transcript_40801/m.105853 type:complete len:274 (-) Transcript_40801:25-846(-)